MCNEVLPLLKVRGTGSSLTTVHLTFDERWVRQVWDFATATASVTMTGHGGDIKACDWHPSKVGHPLLALYHCKHAGSFAAVCGWQQRDQTDTGTHQYVSSGVSNASKSIGNAKGYHLIVAIMIQCSRHD